MSRILQECLFVENYGFMSTVTFTFKYNHCAKIICYVTDNEIKDYYSSIYLYLRSGFDFVPDLIQES